nr:hypothetical protein GCM10025732_01410 [Glycomyces mayteni]
MVTSGPIDAVDVHSRVGIFVNLARRLQSLVHREIEQLDELENQVEDPDLLKGLFSVDHLATRIRRHAENLAVLGGATSHRQWSRPVNVYEALRSAVAEVEQYARVKLVRPIEGTLKGHAVADIIHLVAELVENATTFSAPGTQVLIRVQRVRTGLAVEVEDRGLGMENHERNRYNTMLATPDRVDLDELLADGRIGLYVVSSLARRHTLTVQLQSNIFGGTQAVLVVPEELLGDDTPPAPKAAPGASGRAAVDAGAPARFADAAAAAVGAAAPPAVGGGDAAEHAAAARGRGSRVHAGERRGGHGRPARDRGDAGGRGAVVRHAFVRHPVVRDALVRRASERVRPRRPPGAPQAHQAVAPGPAAAGGPGAGQAGVRGGARPRAHGGVPAGPAARGRESADPQRFRFFSVQE